MAKVLITGGEGYIGSHTAFAFLDAGFEVAIVDDYSAGVRVSYPRAPQNQVVPIFEGDCGDEVFMDKVLSEVQPMAVLHFAGSVIVPESVADPQKYYLNNTQNSLNLIGSCVRAGVENFVFSSTAAVYGMPESGTATEQDRLAPINPYGRSKLMVEQMLADISAATPLRYAALRYFNVAGADPQGRTGQSSPQATHLIKIACEVAAGTRAHMDIFGDDYPTPDGTCLRDYIHVSDLAQAHLAALQFIQSQKQNATFNCGRGQGYSVKEVIRAVEAVAGKSIAAHLAPRRAGDPPQLIADPSLFLRQTDWRPRWTDMKDIVSHALAWEKGLHHQTKK